MYKTYLALHLCEQIMTSNLTLLEDTQMPLFLNFFKPAINIGTFR